MTNHRKLAELIQTLTEIAGAALTASEDSADCDDALAALEVIESRCRVAVAGYHGDGEEVWEPSPAEVAERIRDEAEQAAYAAADMTDVTF